MKKLSLADHKKEFLKSRGFTQTYSSDQPVEYKGELFQMEKWENHSEAVSYILYIHFSTKESNHCELYFGTNDNEADIFSERNLVSQIIKRTSFTEVI